MYAMNRFLIIGLRVGLLTFVGWLILSALVVNCLAIRADLVMIVLALIGFPISSVLTARHVSPESVSGWSKPARAGRNRSSHVIDVS